MARAPMLPAISLVASVVLALATSHPAEADAPTERAKTLFQEGVRAYEAGKLHEARKKLMRAYKLTRSPALAYNVAKTYDRMGEAVLAIRFYKVYLQRGGATEEEQTAVSERIEELRAIATRQRNQVFTVAPSKEQLSSEGRTFFLRGVSMFRRRQYAAAMQAFTAAHRFAPLPEVLYNMAVAAEKLGQSRDAMDYYREYLRASRNPADRAVVERKVRELKAALRR